MPIGFDLHAAPLWSGGLNIRCGRSTPRWRRPRASSVWSRTGHRTHDRIWHSYGIIKRFIPREVPAMQKARQQHGEVHYDFINRIQVPIPFGSTLFLLVLDCDSQPGNCGPDRNHAAGRRAREERPHRSGGAMPLVPSLSQTCFGVSSRPCICLETEPEIQLDASSAAGP
jgi:hypothetical protein